MDKPTMEYVDKGMQRIKFKCVCGYEVTTDCTDTIDVADINYCPMCGINIEEVYPWDN